MAVTQEQQEILQLLANAISQSSGAFPQSLRPAASGPAGEEARKARADSIRFRAATKDLKTASKEFEKLANEQNKTADQMKKQVELNSHFISSAINNFDKLNLGPEAFSNLEEIFQVEDQLKVMTQLQETFERWHGDTQTNVRFANEEYDQLVAQLNDVGLTFDDLGVSVSDVTSADGKRRVTVSHLAEAEKNLKDVTNNLSKAQRKQLKQAERRAKLAETASEGFKGLIAGVGVAGTMFIQESRLAMERGVAEARTADGFMDSIGKMQISTSDYMTILGQTRTLQAAINQSGGNFNKELVDAQESLQPFAASSQDAANAAVGFMKNVTLMGVAFNDLEDPLSRQKDLYLKHYRAMGFSLDEFNQMTEDLLNDTDVRHDIARLDKQQRQQYVEALQLRTAENMEMGYSIERAKELNKHFAKISGMNPLERLQKAARERAMMGALGMARQGAELQDILTRLPSMQEGKEKEAAMARATEIRAAAANELKRRRGMGVGSEITFGMLSEKLGFKETADMFQNEALEGRKFDKELATQQQQAIGEVAAATRQMVEGVDAFKAASTSSATVLATMAGAWIFSKGMQSGIEGINSKLTTMIAGNALGGGGGLLGGGGKMAMLGRAGAVGAGLVGIASLAELWQSGGKTSTIYEGLTDMLGGKDLGSIIYDALHDDPMKEENIKRQDDIINQQKEANEMKKQSVNKGQQNHSQLIDELKKQTEALTKLAGGGPSAIDALGVAAK